MKRAFLVTLVIFGLVGPTMADTTACNTYFAYAKSAGDPSTLAPLQYLYQRCLASRNRSTDNADNKFCNCPTGSRCVDGGNRCVPLGNASDECNAGYVRDWDGTCIRRGNRTSRPVE